MSSLAGLCAREEVLCSRLRRTRSDKISGDLGLIFEHGNGLHWCLQNRVLPKTQVVLGRWLCGCCGHFHGGREAWTLPLPPDFQQLQHFRPTTCPKCGTVLTSDNAIYREQRFKDTLRRLAGHTDGFLRHESMPGLGILEGKSINPRGAWQVRSCPKLDHVVQAQCYMWLTGCRWGLIIYWAKDGSGLGSIIPHIIEYDDDHVEAIQALVRDIWDGVDNPEKPLPDRICAHDDTKRAGLCSVTTPCFQEAA